MKIILKDNIDKAVRKITNFEKRHLPETTAKAINITLFGLRKEMMKQLPKKLDRPTKTTISGLFVFGAKSFSKLLSGWVFSENRKSRSFLRFLGSRRKTSRDPQSRIGNILEFSIQSGFLLGSREGFIAQTAPINPIIDISILRIIPASSPSDRSRKLRELPRTLRLIA